MWKEQWVRSREKKLKWDKQRTSNVKSMQRRGGMRKTLMSAKTAGDYKENCKKEKANNN